MTAGEVASIVGEQVVVKSNPNPPAIGSPVYRGKLKAGVVSDVIGRVDDPYLVVKAQPGSGVSVGDTLTSR